MRSHTRPEWPGRAAILAAGMLAFHIVPGADIPAGPAPVRAQEAVVTGRLTSVWEDPLPGRGEARLRHFLSRRDGEMVALQVSEAQLRAPGGVESLSGRHVEVSGTWLRPRRTPGASTDRELEVRSIRISVDPAGAFAEPEGAPIYGPQPWVTVLCRFSDFPATEPHAPSWYQDLLGGIEPGLDHYWREVSFDQVNVAGSDAYGWYDLPQPKSYYVTDSTGVSNLQALKDDCAAAADADIYYPDYVGINFQFNENLAGYSWGGGSTLNIDGVSRFYRVTWMSDWADQFVYAHEMGHGFGLPHSSGPYGLVYDSRWDVMSGARNHNDPTFGWVGPHTISYHKEDLGWIPADRVYDAVLESSETITLHRLGDLAGPGDYMMARVPLIDGSYYTVEARRAVGYDAYLPAEAVILHHVKRDASNRIRAFVVDADSVGDPNDDGARWLPGETFTDGANGITVTIDSETPEGYVVTISVSDPGHIELDPASLAFAVQQGANPAPQSFTIRNSGIGRLAWTASEEVPWLELGTQAGTIAPADSEQVSLTAVSEELAPGNYNATVTVSGNADNSPQTLAVSLDVVAAPVIALLAEPLDLEAAIGVDPPPHEVVIRNEGGTELNWTGTSDVPWMALKRGSGTLAPGAGETDTVVISVEGLELGDYTGALTFDGNASNAPRTLEATLSVTLSPSIALSGALALEAYEGDTPETASLTVGNDGGGTLNWIAVADEDWVSLTPAAGELASGSDGQIQVEVDGSGLAPGTHTASISVSGNADDSPQVANVEFVIVARPALVAQDVADHLMGVRTPLSVADLEYLDYVGNGNGDFDVGDFRAWLQSEGLMSRTGPAGAGEVVP